jgi:hypothetical protein
MPAAISSITSTSLCIHKPFPEIILSLGSPVPNKYFEYYTYTTRNLCHTWLCPDTYRKLDKI